MIFYIGLVASGKTTLYRKLNEEKTMYAVEIELPQSCINDEDIKLKLFNIYYKSKSIDCIISSPCYLPNNFTSLISESDRVIFLDVDRKIREDRIRERSNKIYSNCVIFSKELLDMEENKMNEIQRKLK